MDDEIVIDMHDEVLDHPKQVVYSVALPGQERPRFVTSGSLRAAIGMPDDLPLPESGQTLVYSDLSPFGALHSWSRVPGGLTPEEMVDANLGVGL